MGVVARKKIEGFEDLLAWQKGIELVKQVYFSPLPLFLNPSVAVDRVFHATRRR